jgi:amino acid adenylation domain-containing protein
MQVEKLLKEIRESNIDISLNGDNLQINSDTIEIPETLLISIRSNKHQIIAYLRDNLADKAGKRSIPAVASENGDGYVLSSSQKRMWILSQLEDASVSYNIPAVYRFEGQLNEAALESAFRMLIRRHESLRTVFKETAAGELRQFILSPETITFRAGSYDLRGETAQEERIRKAVEEDFLRPFDLEQGPLLRASLYRMAADQWIFTYVMHHIISDGWSMNILIRELLSFYTYFAEGGSSGEAGLPEPLRIQYKDYASWQQEQVNTREMESHRAYWLSHFQGTLHMLELAGDKARPPMKTYRGGLVKRTFDRHLSNELRAISQQQGGTLFMGLLSLVNILLYRYTGQRDIILGSPVSGRNHADLEEQIGYYVNTLSLRTVFGHDDSFTDLFEKVKEVTLGAYEHQDYPFDELVENLQLKRDLSHNPLFDIVVALQSGMIEKEVAASGGALRIGAYETLDGLTCKFDLLFNFVETAGELQLGLEYNSDIYNSDTIEKLADNLEQLLSAILRDTAAPVSRLDFLGEAERRRLIHDLNNTETDYPRSKTITDLFEDQAASTPDNTALISEASALSYRELNERANQFAHYLQDRYAACPGDKIAIQLERSDWTIITILGVLKTGAAYLPLEPDAPQQRISYMVTESKCKLLIDENELEAFRLSAGQYERKNPGGIAKPGDLAYVMYTSGSTGKPKGVMIAHTSVVRLVRSTNYISLSGQETLLSTASLSFDVTTFEYWAMLLNGGRLVMCRQEVLLNPVKLAEQIGKNKVDTMWFTAGWLNQLVDTHINIFKGLRTVLAGGDKLSPAHIRMLRLQYPDLQIINGYGPTENATFSLTFDITSLEENEDIPIGKPISNSTAYILDECNNLMPVGAIGEICVGGAGLSRGYLNQPDLTAQKFVPHPFHPDEKIYRTGDLGRWLPDGNIAFIGRKDDQVKVRGYLVELKEIENALEEHPDIESAVVVARAVDTRKELIAYIVAGTTLTAHEVRSYLGERLPAYMVPAAFVQLKELPLNVNGKVDKHRLPVPEGAAMQTGIPYVAPSGETEPQLALIWQELLGKERIGAADNFFELGGHSLSAIRMIAAAKKQFGVEIGVRHIFRQPVLKELAAVIDAAERTGDLPVIVPAEGSEYVPLSFSQQRLWFIDSLQGSLNYQVPIVLSIKGPLDSGALSAALKYIISRHGILRTVIREANSIQHQELLSPDRWELRFSEPAAVERERARELIQQLVERPFDLSADYMLRAHLIKTGDDTHTLAMVIHHIAFDGWSATVFTNELIAAYRSIKEGSLPELPALPVQYADYAVWQRRYLTGAVLEEKLAYWADQLKDAEPLNFPSDFVRPPVQSYKGDLVIYRMGRELKEALLELSRKEGCTIFMTLLAAFKVLLYRYSGQEDICIGTTVANRPFKEVEPLIGFFVNTLALRSSLKGNPSFTALLARIKETTLSAYAHQDVPFESVVDKVVEGRDMSRNPLFDVLFTLHNNPAPAAVDAGDITLFREQAGTYTSQFDMNFNVMETAEGLYLEVEYCSDLFLRETIQRLLLHYETLLSSIVRNPGREIAGISMLPAQEEALILGKAPTVEGHWFNRGVQAFDNGLPVNVRFEQVVEKYGHAVAVVHRGEEWTYDSINRLANRIAHTIEPVAGPGACIGVYLDRDPVLIACFLGILKSGNVYIPLDPQNPADRIEKMISGNGMSMVISTSTLIKKLERIGTGHVLLVNETDEELEKRAAAEHFQLIDQAAITTGDDTNPANLNTMQSWAYVLFTSGSTGEPKGAILHHEGAVNHILAEYEALELPDHFRFLQSAGTGSDISVWQILGPLLKGGAVVIIDKDELLEYNKVLDIITTRRVNLVEFVPTYTWGLIEYIKNLEEPPLLEELSWIMLTGERVPVQLANELKTLYPRLRVLNCYGPCEASDDVVQYEVKKPFPEGQLHVPIGRPIPNMNVFVLDQAGALCPVGVPGELYVAGVGVGFGYWGMQEKTAASFKENLFPGTLGRTIYKTGDTGKWLPDGNLVFLGRVDNQVKIRGHRVELGEIESLIRRAPGVNDCHVLICRDDKQQEHLVAFIVLQAKTPDTSAEESSIQAVCRDGLPAFMQPTHYCIIDSMPVNVSDKVDEKKLLQYWRENKSSAANEGKAAAPRNETEQRIAEIWKRVLQVNEIGIDDNFFTAGGHSLLATRVMTAIRKELEVQVSISDLFKKPTIAELAAQVNATRKKTFLPPIGRQERPVHIPLSYSQERLWFIDALQGSTHYHMPAVIRLSGKLDVQVLESAFTGIVNRHEALRTVFRETDGIPYQVVLPENTWKLDVSTVAYDEAVIEGLIAAELKKPFDLANDFMLRARLMQIGENEHLLTLMMHHIASDGWSVTILIKELAALYRAAAEGVPANLPALPVQYVDYSLWQQQYLDKVIDEKMPYWERQLAGTAPLNLPTDFKRPLEQATKGDIVNHLIDKGLTQQLYELSKQEGVTLYVTLLAAFKVLLFRYSGQEDICVGSPVANRMQKEIEPLIGCFINTLALRSKLRADLDFRQLLRQVKEMTLQAYNHQEVPFEKIIDRVAGSRDLSRSSLFQVLFTLDNNEDPGPVDIGDITLMAVPFRLGISKFDLSFNITEGEAGLYLDVTYSNDLFLEATITRMVGHFETLLRDITANSAKEIGALEMLSAEEQEQLLTGFNTAVVPYPADKAMPQLFDEQVAATPDNIALVFGESRLSYRELQQKANKLAHYLRKAGIRENVFAAICLDNPLEMVVAILAVWKSGAAYVPVDPDFPQDRIHYMMSDAGTRCIITNETCSKLLPPADNVPVVLLDTQCSLIAQETDANPDIPVYSRHSAYVIYTSGSTGKPKGVNITHRNLVDYFYGLFAATDITACRSFGLMSTLAADLGYTILFGALLSGGKLHLFSRDLLGDADILHAYFGAHPIDCIKIAPSHWKALDREAPLLPLKTIIFGGEELTADMLERIRSANAAIDIINHYGPTETTIGKLIHRVDRNRAYQEVPVGLPFSNAQVYVLNAHKRLCPVGVPGELFISGDGVSAGYLNKPGLTAEKFIDNPYLGRKRMYATGDLVRRLPDGSIVFSGRADNQVKIRGYRVELGEVESILREQDAVTQAVVMARKDRDGQLRLAAYVVPGESYERAALIGQLRKRLPEYMVPSLVVELAALPLTANGKVNRQALPEPSASALSHKAYVAPANGLEKDIAAIWQRLLHVGQVGADDNFFELGGHSLLAARVVSAIRKELYKEITIRDLFLRPTVRQLSAAVSGEATAQLLPPLTAQARSANIPPSFSQERLWFIDKLQGSLNYHIPIVLKIQGGLSRLALERSVETVLNRHEVLRTVLRETENGLLQEILPPVTGGLKYIVLPSASQEQLQQLIAGETSAPFDLSSGPLIRFTLVGLSETMHVLIIVAHHIVSDGWSRSILVNELVSVYQSVKAGQAPALPPLPVQYADYALWQRAYLEGDVLERKLSYWVNKLQHTEPLNLPLDFARPSVQSTRGGIVSHLLDKQLCERLTALSRQENATLFMTLLAAFKVLLYKYTGQHDICIGTPVANRIHAETESLIGCFINTLVLRSDLQGNPSFRELLSQVKETTLSAYNHQDTPYEHIVVKVVEGRDMSRNPLFDVMFSLHNNPVNEAIDIDGLSLIPEAHEHVTSQFDLNVNCRDTPEGLQFHVEYCSDLFYRETVQRLLRHYETLLLSIVSDVTETIDNIQMLPAPERELILGKMPTAEGHWFNRGAVDNDNTRPINVRFEEIVEKNEDAIAVILNDEEWSYQQLNALANRVSHSLTAMGVQAGECVAVYLDRSPVLIACLLGILKSGAVYVPLDTQNPAERIGRMLSQHKMTVLITDTRLEAGLQTGDVQGILLVDEADETTRRKYLSANITVYDNTDIQAHSASNPANRNELRSWAYVLFTSGSTGEPKGAITRHDGAINHILAEYAAMELPDGFRFLQSAGIGSDISVWQMLGPVLKGGTIVMISKEDLMDYEKTIDLLNEKRVTLAEFVPTYAWGLIEYMKGLPAPPPLPYLACIMLGGENVPVQLVNQILMQYPGLRLLNVYGPCEASDDIVQYEIKAPLASHVVRVPIGRPVANMNIFILDKTGALCPVGVPGEICVSGTGVGAGYWEMPEKTAASFVKNPFDGTLGDTIYKTGDLGRWLPDGNLEFWRRIDNQVKIRGHRVELGEIEALIRTQEGVKDCHLIIHSDDTEENLIAFILPGAADGDGAALEEQVRQRCREGLPSFMQPGYYCTVEAFPVNLSDKVDEKHLLELFVARKRGMADENKSQRAPRNETEQKLADIWKTALKKQDIGVQDNFFECGGHSLLVTKVVLVIRKEFSLNLPVNTLFKYSTIEELAAYIQLVRPVEENSSAEYEVMDL